jgi:hypothetical protein
MALSNLTKNTARHFWVRVAGLTGLLIAVAGVALWATAGLWVGIAPVIIGGAVALIVLVMEMAAAAAAGGTVMRRGAVSSNAAGQIALAALLLVLVNLFSFTHYLRFDWTGDGQFTLPADLREQLAQLRDETRIVVFLPHTPINPQATHPDNYDAAAEAQIVEKVRDLAEQFQELGPRFRVDVLDVKAKGYSDKLAELTKGSPQLAEAISSAKENTIFIQSGDHVQRLGLQDIYQLDKEESKKGGGNLVLRYQGAHPLANKVLNVEEKRPRVAVGVIHEVLGFDNNEGINRNLGMSGAKKVLTGHGFEVRDIILKKWGDGEPEPAVLTRDENKYEELEDRHARLETSVKDYQKDYDEINASLKKFKTSSLDDLNKELCIVVEEGVLVPKKEVEAAEKKIGKKIETMPLEEKHRELLVRNLSVQLVPIELALKRETQERDATASQMKGLNVENLHEQRRITDLHAKLNRSLADADLLIVPRLTLVNVVRGLGIPMQVYRLDPAQISAIKDFIKAGKPVLFCLGPTNEPPGRFDPEAAMGDALEQVVNQLGFRLSRETILFNSEVKSFGQRRPGIVILDPGEKVEIPPTLFDWEPGAGQPGILGKTGDKKTSPVATSLRIAARSLSSDEESQFRLRHPRPVYYVGSGDRAGEGKDRFVDSSVFMMSAAESWNEPQPYPTAKRVPHYEPPKPGTSAADSLEGERRGPFPIAVAAEVAVPKSWFSDKELAGTRARIGVIGHGGAFSGDELSPTQKQLVLDTSNWLLGRDDLLAREGALWQFPRLDLSSLGKVLIFLFLVVGPPALSVFLGAIVFLVRRMR